MDLLLGLAGLTGLSALLQSKVLPSEKEYQKAIGDLALNNNDPAANLIAGKYETFVLGDFQFGLQHLAKGSDKTLAALAQKEIDEKNSDTPEKKVALGDEWVLTAKKYPALTTQLYDHASDWYADAWPKLNAQWKARLREQSKRLSISRPPGVKRKGLPSGWKPDAGISGGESVVDGNVSHSGSYSGRPLPANPDVPGSGTALSTELIPVTGNTAHLSLYALSDSTENAGDRVVIHFFNQAGERTAEKSVFIQNDMPFWRKVVLKTDIPKNTARAYITVALFSKKGNLWVDDVSLLADDVEVMKNGSFEQK